MSTTSASLLERIRHDPAASQWQTLVELYDPLIRGWLKRQSVLQADADDLVQDVLTVVARRLKDFEHNGRTGAFRTWLRTVTINCVRDSWRSKKRENANQGQVQELLDQLTDPNSGLTQAWDLEHDRYVTQQLLGRLRSEFEPATWKAFERVALDGTPAAQVATELGLTVNAVFIAKSRILARLRQESRGLIDD
ncbi:RNA polymerase sigma factor [Anatilimnocola aggregata]|uniref:RNA polymerase sigma factor n=1 Tax=Anatilimnocola aggregata TaxID=2528021 RepID=A0A517YKW6_9BACT|nr:sigma-70 family RNA polymerase sigma factor [Anatilimnocola aggregata]QDU30875.1 RNA polymerase sigma factor [Anatilimnocola aggregata]